MIQYTLKRALKMIPTLLVISAIIFFLVNLAPGDFVDTKVNPNMTAEKVEQLKAVYGLDKPLTTRYINWLKGVLQGDFGDSLRYQQSTITIIGKYVWNSFLISGISFLLCLIISIPLGIISATKQYSIFDKTFTVLSFLGISLPSFFVALMLTKVFSLNLGWFPISGMTTAGSSVSETVDYLDIARHCFLPILSLTIIQFGTLIRYVRTSMLEVIRQDYIRTARAKGLSEKVVIYKHALRNGLIPVVTYIGMSIPALFAGAIITETIFVWPGIGKIGYEAVLNRDYTLTMAFTMFMAVLTLVGNLLSDILYAVVDPRIKLK